MGSPDSAERTSAPTTVEEARSETPVAPLPDLPPTAERTPVAKKSGFSIAGSLPHLVGRTAASLAVTGAIIGALFIGTPIASPPVHDPATQVTMRVDAPARPEAGRAVSDLSKDVRSLLPAGLDAREVLRSVGYVSFSVRAEQGLVAANSRLDVPPGTRISASLDRSGLTFSADPGVGWRLDWLPDAHLHRVSYDFRSARFTASASGFGPDSWYSSKLEELANENLAKFLPEAMRRPGYDPFADADLELHVAQLVDAITGATHARDPNVRHARDAGASHRAAEPSLFNVASVTSPALSFEYDVDSARTIDIPGSEQRVWLEAGTRIYVTTSTTGPVTDPTLERLSVSFSKPVTVASGQDRPASMARIDVRSMELGPNAQLTMDYELGPEQAVDGVRALAVLFAIAADPRVASHVGDMRPSRMERLRGEVQAKIDGVVEPKLIELLRANDHAVNGTSLLHFFGVQPDRVPPRP